MGQISGGDEVSIPLSFLLDKQGRIEDIFSGWSPEIRTQVLQLVD